MYKVKDRPYACIWSVEITNPWR